VARDHISFNESPKYGIVINQEGFVEKEEVRVNISSPHIWCQRASTEIGYSIVDEALVCNIGIVK
jgi:hypothetical protein